jgi:hypothetical protein
MVKRDRLISCSNMFSKNWFEKEEEINNATNLTWNRNYEEAINAACKIWTGIIQIDKSQTQFAKIRVLQIMIQSSLNIVLSVTKDTEEWLLILKSINYNGLMTTTIWDIKLRMGLT